ncbi:MAG: hypothetical protein ACYCZD_03675 [Rhodanobacter sp.]
MNKTHLLAAVSLILGGSLLLAGCGQHGAGESSTTAQTVSANPGPTKPVKATSISNHAMDSAKSGGLCSIDAVSGQGATNDAFTLAPSKAMVFGGWAATTDKTNPGHIILVLKGAERFQAPGSTGGQRADVVKAFSSPGLTQSGFNFIVDATPLPKGTYQLMVLEPGTNPPTLCNTHKTLVLE